MNTTHVNHSTNPKQYWRHFTRILFAYSMRSQNHQNAEKVPCKNWSISSKYHSNIARLFAKSWPAVSTLHKKVIEAFRTELGLNNESWWNFIEDMYWRLLYKMSNECCNINIDNVGKNFNIYLLLKIWSYKTVNLFLFCHRRQWPVFSIYSG